MLSISKFNRAHIVTAWWIFTRAHKRARGLVTCTTLVEIPKKDAITAQKKSEREMRQMSTLAAASLSLCTWPQGGGQKGGRKGERTSNAARASISCTLALRLGCSRRTLANACASHHNCHWRNQSFGTRLAAVADLLYLPEWKAHTAERVMMLTWPSITIKL